MTKLIMKKVYTIRTEGKRGLVIFFDHLDRNEQNPAHSAKGIPGKWDDLVFSTGVFCAS